jgi:hypothetical protein
VDIQDLALTNGIGLSAGATGDDDALFGVAVIARQSNILV